MTHTSGSSVIRSAIHSDVDSIQTVFVQAFRDSWTANRMLDVDTYIQQRTHNLNDIGQWRVHDEQGRITAALHIARDEMRIGEAILLRGDVGEVSVLPECQGQGLGTRMMQDAIQWLNTSDYDLSRLGGLTRFYARFGYVPFPRRYMELSVGETIGAGASRVTQGALPLCGMHRQRIRRLDRNRDLRSVEILHDQMSRRYAASHVRVDPQPGPLTFVYESDGEVSGWLAATQSDHDDSDIHAAINIHALEYDTTQPCALQALMTHIYNYALGKGVMRITGRLPFDPSLRAALREIGILFKEVEMQGGQASNMLQVTNLHSLLAHLAPELEARLALLSEHKWSGKLAIDIGKASAAFRIKQGAITPCDLTNPDIRLTIGEFDFMQMILGLVSFTEIAAAGVCGGGLGATERNLLAGLFPRCLVNSSGWG